VRAEHSGRQSVLRRDQQRVQALVDVATEMYAKRSPVTLREDREISTRLGRLDDPERETPAGNIQIRSVLTGQL